MTCVTTHVPRDAPMSAQRQGRRRVQTQERRRDRGRKNKQQFQFTTKSISKLKSPGNSNRNRNSSSSSARGGTDRDSHGHDGGKGGAACVGALRFYSALEERVTDVVRDVDRRKVASALNASLNGYGCHCRRRRLHLRRRWQMSQVAACVRN